MKMVKMFCNNIPELIHVFVIRIFPASVIYLKNMVSYGPDKVGEIWISGHKLKHSLILHSVDIEGDGSDSNPHHAFAVVEELDCLGVEREVIGAFVIEETNCVFVQAE